MRKALIVLNKREQNIFLVLRIEYGLCLLEIELTSIKDALCQVRLILTQWFSRKRFFDFVNVFLLFHYHLPTLENGGTFLWTTFNPHRPRMLCSKFGWNWPSCSGEEDFWIMSMYLRYFLLCLLGIGRGPSFEQAFISITQGCSVQNLI